MINKDCKIQILPSQNRRSISIQVYPDCTVKVRVPRWLPQKNIDQIIEQKQAWISKKIEHFQQNQKNLPRKKEYVSGEVFCYLGKEYQLRVVEAKNNSIMHTESEIFIHKTPKRSVKNILTKWFSDMAKEVFEERLKVNFAIFSKKHQYPYPNLTLRKMKSRWGSMSSDGNMTLNTHLIHTPFECIDYVIMHELCHLKHKNHGAKFHKLQGEFTPNYKEIKRRLEDFNIRIGLL